MYDYVWTQIGDPHSGTFDLTETGATRYDQIELFKDVSNTQTGQTPGHMNVYPFGQTFVDPGPRERPDPLGRPGPEVIGGIPLIGGGNRFRNAMGGQFHELHSPPPIQVQEAGVGWGMFIRGLTRLFGRAATSTAAQRAAALTALVAQRADLARRIEVAQRIIDNPAHPGRADAILMRRELIQELNELTRQINILRQ